MAHDVFICHSSKDRTIANAICSTLEQNHIRCWIAPRDVLPGSDYGGAIIEAISATRLTVLVFSSHSNDSPHVRREIERTISHGIPVLPFRVEEITPSPALEYFISDAHWLDAMTPPLEQHLEHLVGTVRLLLEREAARAADASKVSPAPGEGAATVPAPSGGTAPEAATSAAVGASQVQPRAAASAIGGTGTTARRRPSAPVIAGVGVAAIALLAVGAFLMTGGGRPGASQTALGSASPAPSGSSSGTPAPGTSPSASAGPPADVVARIKAALPASLSCDPPEAPSDGSGELASAFCYVGDTTISYASYTLYASLQALRSDYGSWLDYYQLAAGTAGSCAKGQAMEASWSFTATPSVTEGHYFCVVDGDKQANLYWSDEASLMVVHLAGDTAVTLDKLFEIWRTRSYDPVRSSALP